MEEKRVLAGGPKQAKQFLRFIFAGHRTLLIDSGMFISAEFVAMITERSFFIFSSADICRGAL